MLQTISSIIETFGLGIFIYFLIKGLKQKIRALEETNKQQMETLRVMEKRIEETEIIGGIYRSLISNIPTDIDNYKAFITKTKDDIIFELRDENARAKKQLEDTKKALELSGNPKEKIIKYLSALRVILKNNDIINGIGGDKNIKLFVDHNGRKIEESIIKLIESNTLVDFLNNIGLELIIENRLEFYKQDITTVVLPNRESIKTGSMTWSIYGNQLIANNFLFMDEKMFRKTMDEFSFIKATV